MAIAKTNFRKFLTEKQFLKVAQRARKVTGITITDIKFDGDTVLFKVNSVTTPGKVWHQQIQIVDLLEHSKFEKVKQGVEKGKRDFASHARKAMIKNFKDPLLGRSLEQVILESPIRCFCSCPAFLYWGFKYVYWRKGVGLYPEHRVPHVRNPKLKTGGCKHLHAILSIWPILSKIIARRYKPIIAQQKRKEQEAKQNAGDSSK